MRPSSPKTVYQPQLDGLRAVAVLGVLFDHFALHVPAYLQYGTMSVRLFFVLTGYFMTLTLLRMREESELRGGWRCRDVPRFYGRRLLRILPPLYVYLLAAVVVGIPGMWDSILWHLAFLTNFYIASMGYYPDGSAHLWSLSVQEQFYVLWPWLILFIPARWLVHGLVATALLAVGFRLGCILGGVEPLVRWVMMPGALDAFAVGGLLALAKRAGWWESTGPRFRIRLAIIVLIALISARIMRYWPQDMWMIGMIELLEAAFLGWLLLVVSQGVPGLPGRILGWRPLAYLGTISYGIYLYHILVVYLAEVHLDAFEVQPSVRALGQVFLLIAASVLMAMISWHFMEKPLLKMRPRRVSSPSA